MNSDQLGARIIGEYDHPRRRICMERCLFLSYDSGVWRRLRLIAFCLLFGAVTTALVAWTLSVRVILPLEGGAFARAQGWLEPGSFWCIVKTRPGKTLVGWQPWRSFYTNRIAGLHM